MRTETGENAVSAEVSCWIQGHTEQRDLPGYEAKPPFPGVSGFQEAEQTRGAGIPGEPAEQGSALLPAYGTHARFPGTPLCCNWNHTPQLCAPELLAITDTMR